jgi:plastocyanin
MLRKHIAVALALAAVAVSACAGRVLNGNGGAMGDNIVMLPPIGHDLAVFATLPQHTVGEELPQEGLGTIKSVRWQAVLGGYTQRHYSPQTKITIVNLSHNITHTLDVVKQVSGPPAKFPTNPKLPINAQGNDKFEVGYASGPIKPGKSVTVTLVKAGMYLIGCAFHYHSGMHDVIVVEPHAAPGPQATPPPRSTSSPTARSSYYP